MLPILIFVGTFIEFIFDNDQYSNFTIVLRFVILSHRNINGDANMMKLVEKY